MPPPIAGRHRRGLTLLELVIALAVLAVLGTLAVPSMASAVQRQRLRAVAEQFAADLAEARFRAAQTGQTIKIETHTGPDWCWAVVSVPGCGCAQAQPCQLQRVIAGDHPGVTLAQAGSTHFDPGGTAVPQQAALFVARGGQRLRVDLSPLGRARVCAPEAAGQTMTGVPPC